MEIILNTNELVYAPFLNKKVDSFVIGFKDFCINQKFCLDYKNLLTSISEIKANDKKIYVSINFFATEKDIDKLKKVLHKLQKLDVDGFIVSDLGVANLFKKYNLASKLIIDLQTYVTNKYSALSLLNLGVKRVTISKEITLDDIKEIAAFLNGNVEVLAQGYIPITHSKRNILSCYYKNIKKKCNSSLHFLKEENRDNYYLLSESKDNLTVYNDKEYSLFSSLPELIDSKITTYKIDASYLNEDLINEYIEFYSEGIKLIKENKLNEYNSLSQKFSQKYSFDTPFLHNQSVLLKGGDK